MSCERIKVCEQFYKTCEILEIVNKAVIFKTVNNMFKIEIRHNENWLLLKIVDGQQINDKWSKNRKILVSHIISDSKAYKSIILNQ